MTKRPHHNRHVKKYTEYDEPVMEMIAERGPILSLTMREELGIKYSVIDTVLKRLSSRGGIEYQSGWGWRLKPGKATSDTSPFPPPPYVTPDVGLWG